MQVLGVVLVDCVEETALASLGGAAKALSAMAEQRFESPAHAVAWVHHNGVVRNLEVHGAARLLQ